VFIYGCAASSLADCDMGGVPSAAVKTIAPHRNGMAVKRSFGTPAHDFHAQFGAVTQYAMCAGEKL
jgi:hypothetical protein